MIARGRGIVGIYLLMLAGPVASAAHSAARNPLVRIVAWPAAVAVGQAVRVSVTVLVPTWFTTPPVFPTYELPNAVTRLPDKASHAVSETIDNETWSGVRRDYFIYPQIAARYALGKQSVQASYADPGQRSPINAEATVPAVAFSSTVPRAAKRLQPFLAATKLDLRQDIEGDATALVAGDSLVRRVVVSSTGGPVLFLPPLLAPDDIGGISTYPSEPEFAEVVDAADGQIAAIRAETLTYMFERAGTYTLPGVSLEWWNNRTGKVERSALPAVTISVSADANDRHGQWRASRSFSYLATLCLATLCLAGALAWRRRLRVQAYFANGHASERYAFGRLMLALAAGNLRPTHRFLEHWLERLRPGLTCGELGRLAQTPLLASAGEKIGAALFGPQPNERRLRILERCQLAWVLARTRRAYRRSERRRAGGALPPLNPPVPRRSGS